MIRGIEADADADADGEAVSGEVARPADFRALYDEHVAFVWRNLRRLGVWPNELDDRTQEVFVVAFRRLPAFEDRGVGIRAWLYQILLRVASEARRHRRRHPEDATEDLGAHCPSEPTSSNPATLLERRRDLETLDRALETIDVGRRAVLVLHEIEEMSAPEIARILEIPANTVYSRLRVARAELELALRGVRAGTRGAR
jgi:RNA polymerase sigma-70 factor (ECF subfamily)